MIQRMAYIDGIERPRCLHHHRRADAHSGMKRARGLVQWRCRRQVATRASDGSESEPATSLQDVGVYNSARGWQPKENRAHLCARS